MQAYRHLKLFLKCKKEKNIINLINNKYNYLKNLLFLSKKKCQVKITIIYLNYF